jgi:hypothetical protein
MDWIEIVVNEYEPSGIEANRSISLSRQAWGSLVSVREQCGARLCEATNQMLCRNGQRIQLNGMRKIPFLCGLSDC